MIDLNAETQRPQRVAEPNAKPMDRPQGERCGVVSAASCVETSATSAFLSHVRRRRSV